MIMPAGRRRKRSAKSTDFTLFISEFQPRRSEIYEAAAIVENSIA
jgi:hypothetical protein